MRPEYCATQQLPCCAVASQVTSHRVQRVGAHVNKLRLWGDLRSGCEAQWLAQNARTLRKPHSPETVRS